MTALDRLRLQIEKRELRLRTEIPRDAQAALLAVIRSVNQQRPTPVEDLRTDLITGRHVAGLGENTAIQFCLESVRAANLPAPELPGAQIDGWAEQFLQTCSLLVEARLVVAHCETGFMRLVEDDRGNFAAWIATKVTPTSWRERSDFDWWAAWLVRHHEPELSALLSELVRTIPGQGHREALFRRIAEVHLEIMNSQLGYPPDAVIGGCSIQAYKSALSWLISLAYQSQERGDSPVVRSQAELVAQISTQCALDPTVAANSVSAFTLNESNAAYHSAVPGIAPAPLVRIAPDRVVLSMHGLTAQPLLFLARELRRSDPSEYHNTAHLREGVFRQDLYALFQDKRFVTSDSTVELRRERGDVRTDIDAMVFDRKTGTLGVFELKTQDPFARSTSELARQRDNMLRANRQVSGVLDWVNRHGASELLGRVDRRTARTFRVQKVFPFVLGRYLAHFSDGPMPDRRAAWATWPQILRRIEGQPFHASDGNPVASLFSRLKSDDRVVHLPADHPPRTIALGDSRLTVYSSHAAFRASTAPE
jgi:hypothetical protein